MFNGQNRRLAEYKVLGVRDVTCHERFHEPTKAAINRMADSLARDGQQVPIIVCATARGYELVAGATRLKAAEQLGWAFIQTKVMRQSPLDCKITELVENECRSDLTHQQRDAIRARLKELREERGKAADRVVAKITTKAKGGRGKKGGVADAARQAGVSRASVQRRMNKPARTKSEQVSDEGPPPEERWQNSLANICGDLISLSAYWNREFPGWKKFECPSDIKQLVKDATTALASISQGIITHTSRKPAEGAE